MRSFPFIAQSQRIVHPQSLRPPICTSAARCLRRACSAATLHPGSSSRELNSSKQQQSTHLIMHPNTPPHNFSHYLFAKIIREGGIRMQLIASDVVNQLQEKYPPKHPLNLHRKQYGNIYEALKALKCRFFELDSMVIRMRPPAEVRECGLPTELLEEYEAQLVANRAKEVQIMKVNSENECSKCGRVFNIHVNKAGSCGPGQHSPRY